MKSLMKFMTGMLFNVVCVRASRCGGFSHCRAQVLECTGSMVVLHGLSCSRACGTFPDQGSFWTRD